VNIRKKKREFKDSRVEDFMKWWKLNCANLKFENGFKIFVFRSIGT